MRCKLLSLLVAATAALAIGCSGDALTAPEAVPDAQFGHTGVECAVGIQPPAGEAPPLKLRTPGHACEHTDPGTP